MRQVMRASKFYRLLDVSRETGRTIAKRLPRTVATCRDSGSIYRIYVDVDDVAEYLAAREQKRIARKNKK